MAEAEPLYRRALAIDEKSGFEPPNVARDLNNLGLLLCATNRPEEAEPLLRQGLTIGEKTFGSQHTHVATLLSSLAKLLKDTNRLAEAEPLMRRALTIDEKNFGFEDPKVAIRLDSLAGLLQGRQPARERPSPSIVARSPSTKSPSDPNTPKWRFDSTSWETCFEPATGSRKPSPSIAAR